MEEGRRSGDPSGYLVKNRSGGSGRLIVKKRGNDGTGGLGSSGSRNVFGSKKEKKRARLSMSDSGSSDDLLMPPRRRVAPETLRVCNGLSHYDAGVAEENDIGRKRIRGGESVRNNEVALIGRSGEDHSERKRKMLDVFEFDEYDGSDEELVRKPFDDGRMDGRRYIGSMSVGRSGLEREYETGSSRHPVVDRRNSSYLERIRGVNRGDHSDRDRTRPPVPFYGNKYDSDGHIRVQGKNGVLKVMVNKKKKVSGSSSTYDPLEVEEKRKGSRSEDTFKRNVLTRPTFYTQPKVVERAGPSVNKLKNPNKLNSSSAKRLPVRNGTIKDEDSDDSGTSLKLGPLSVENLNTRKTPLSNRSLKGQEEQSEDSDTSLKLGPKNADSRKFMKHAVSGGEIVPSNELSLAKSKEGKVKRGTGTEKQKLREKIRGMLLSAGWTIDYRPRRNRDYLDAVYINPNGTAYWSIIKAYDALLKQLNEEEEAAKAKGDASFRPLPDEVLSQLTRKTRKKMEKEMKKKQRDANESANARETAARRSSSSRHDEESIDSGSHEEKLSSFIKQSASGKSVKSRINCDGSLNPNVKGQSSTHHLHPGMEPSGVNSHQGRRTRKLGRCTLLVRNSNDGLNSDSDGYVPYTGKRTVLSWLIDCGAVQLSQKVRYMNRRRTKVMLEGWVTRDGIHCGCCSKILTVLKFEIHAGSKQRQPFQNICLDSGVSLLECQIDAWNRQESVEHTGFHSVDVDGDDPNDDTCGLCGDGGDLICCDSCPSTFHLSCLDIEMLPPGDWHCPHCTCKFCGLAGEDSIQGDDATVCGLLTCSLCAKQYHTSCSQGVDALSIDADGPVPCFCGKTCKEVFEQLQKYLGVKHELESGLSWCLIHRTDVDLDITPQGLPSRVECNSKLAVALSVMDECFLPVVDRRSGINLLHSVLYNCGSNFNRLNFSGFFAAILERGDEIIAAASIRLHGTELAEMPFIGTRHIYRRQGMCRRLFCAIESALCSLKVQRMIIPAISELTPTWTGFFGFTNIDRSLKQELKSINMLVFPGIDMLQKQLFEQENKSENRTIATVVRGMKFEDNQCITSDAAIRSDIDSSAKHDPDECDDGDLEHASRANDEALTRNSDPQCMDVPLNNTALRSSSSGSSDENKNSAPLEEETVHTDFDPVEIRSPCIADKVDSISVSSSAEKNVQSCIQGNVSHTNSDSGDLGVALDDASVMNGSFDPDSEQKNPVVVDRTICADMESGSKLAELIPDNKFPISADSNGGRQEENKHDAASPIEDDTHSYKEGGIEDARELNLNKSASDELKMSKSNEDARPVDYQSEDKFVEEDADKLYVDFPCLEAASPIADKDAASPIQDGTNSYKEGGIEDAYELSLNNSASDELKMSKSIEDTRPVDYQSEDKFVEEDADKLNADLPYLETASPIADEDETSPMEDDSHYYKEGGIEDAPELNLNESASDELKMSNSIEDARPVDYQSEDKFVEEDADKVYADLPCLEVASPIADKVADLSAASPIADKVADLSAASPIVDDSHSYKDSGIEDAHELNLNESVSDELKMRKSAEDTRPIDYQSDDKIVEEDAGKVYADLPCLEAATSTKETDADNSTKMADKIESINGAYTSSMQTDFDQKDEMVCVREATS